MRKVLGSTLAFALILATLTGCSRSGNTDAKPSSTAEVIPPAPTSLEDLKINPESVAYWAWKKSSVKILKSVAKANQASIEVGPNTTPDYLSTQVAVDLASKLYSDFQQGQKLNFVYYEYEDTAWAQSKLNDFLGENILGWQKEQAKTSCISQSDCFGAVAITHPIKPAGIILVTASAAGKKDANHISGTLEAHEFTHIIQDEQQGKFLGKVPRWHAEGEAMFAQAAAIHHLDFAKYKTERERIINGLIKNPEISKSWLVDFISPKSGLVSWQVWDKYDGWRVYDIGMLVTEVLASFKGPESTMKLSLEVGKGESYQNAFEKIYEISWKSAVPLIAEIIYSELNS